jgi:hypothetical protein
MSDELSANLPAKVVANRRNARLSTGPNTPNGKSRSRLLRNSPVGGRTFVIWKDSDENEKTGTILPARLIEDLFCLG